MNLFVTGYGPFGTVTENPSGLIAARLGSPHQVLDVTFCAADTFLDEFGAMPYDALLMIGVAASAERMRLETVARNRIGHSPDVAGVVMGPGPVNAAAPRQLHASLWSGFEQWLDSPDFEPSVDAGDYLCNYLAFEAARRYPKRETGFLHVPLPRPGFGVEEMADSISRFVLAPLMTR